MSVVIKGMDIPKSCFDCGLMQFDEMCDEYCAYEYCAYVYGKDKHYLDNDVEKNRPEWCPLVELPEKHGRLIDGNYLYNRLKALGLKDENVFRIIKEEPTVIESEK